MTICGYKYTYAALTKGYMCLCGDLAPAGLTLEPSKCTVPCVGDGAQTCGSDTHIDLFDAIKPVTSSLVASKKVAAIGESVSFVPNVATDGSGWNLRMNYGDGAGLSEYAASPGTDLLHRTFYQAGEYIIGAYLTDPDKKLPDTVSKISVHVETPVSGITINCPTDMATYEPEVCFIEVMAGTHMQVDILPDGVSGPTKSFPISDAVEFSLGNAVQENILTAALSSTSTNGLVLHPGNYGKKAGTLLRFEYFAADTGTLNIFVYRPVVACGGNEYCAETNSCVTPGTCGVWTCSGDEFCTDTMRCCSASPLVTSSAVFNSYMKVYTKSVTISAIGYGYVDVKSDAFAMLEGDIIAHSATGGAILAQVPPVSGEESQADFYCSGVDGTSVATVNSASCTLQTELHHLKAVVARKSTIYFPVEYTSPGSKDFTVTVSNRGITGSETKSFTITVVEGVDQAILVLPQCIAANEEHHFTLEMFTGQPVDIHWDFGDGSTDVENGVSTTSQSHTYTSTGLFDLKVNISNIKSFKFNETQVCVEERITGFAISLPLSYVEVGVASALRLGMASGSDYTCALTFNDGSSDVVVSTNEAATPPNTDYMHTFSSAGDYTVSVVCSNQIGTVSYTLTTRAVERVGVLSLDPTGAIAGADFRIYVFFTSGSDVDVALTYAGASKAMTVIEVERKAVSEVIPATSIGKQPVSVVVSNIINTETLTTDFFIEVAITNPVVNCHFLNEITTSLPAPNVVIPTNSDVQCDVTMEQGTSVDVTITWGDAAAPYTYSLADGDPWLTDLNSISHSFTTPEICSMSVVLENGFNSFKFNYIVNVMTNVDHVEINSVSPVEFTPPASVTFSFSITSGPVPNGVTCEMSWGDRHVDIFEDCDLTQPLTHIYRDVPGELTCEFKVSNIVSSKTGSTPVSIVTPIRDMEVYTNPPAAVVNVPFDLVFKAWRAPGAGILNLTFFCEDGVGSPIGPMKRINNSPYGEDTVSCSHPTNRTYTTKVVAESYFEIVEATYDVVVQYPVTEEFTVATNAPMDYPATDCMMTYLMTFTGAITPDDAFVEFIYGDDSTSGILPFTNPLNHNYQYSAPGHYTTTLRFFNLASEVIREIPSGCYEDFSGVSMTVLREVFIPIGGPDLPGFGPNQDIFRIDEALKFHMTMSGTFVYHDIMAVSNDSIITCNSTVRDDPSLIINVPGKFRITLIAKNPLYQSDPQIYEAILMEPAANIIITDNGIVTKAYENKEVNISFDVIGAEMCLAVYTGIASELFLYGDETACQTDTSKWSSGSYIASILTNPFTFSHQYTKDGTYHMTVTGYNAYWTTSAYFHFAVTSIDCTAPNIDIKHRHSYFNFPLPLKKINRNRIVGITDLACPDTLNNVKVWRAERYDPINNVPLEPVDLTFLDSSAKSELSIPPLYLQLGLYRFHYKVTMLSNVDGDGFFGEAETFVNIEPSDLVIQIFEDGATLVTTGPAVMLTLQPRKFSFDPDDPDPNSYFDSYTMKCRDLTANETYPDPDTCFTVEDLDSVPVDLGGCFRKGPGCVDSFTGALTFNTSLMKPGHKYEIVVHGYRDTRVSSATANLKVLTGDPPIQAVAFKIPHICKSTPSGKLFNPNYQLGLLASPKCLNCPYTYLWEVYSYEHDYKKTHDGWNLLTYLQNFIEGVKSDELTILTSLFKHYKDIDRFQVRLLVTDTTTGITSETHQNLIRNHPPSGGTCTIFPDTGTAMYTNHTIECVGFTDPENEIEDYIVSCDTTKKSYIVASGSEPLWYDRQLPVGLDEDGNVLVCKVKVSDDLGSSETYFIQNVTSLLMSREQLKETVAIMATDNSNKIKFLKSSGTLEQVTGYTLSLATALDVMSKDGENSEYAGVPAAPHAEATSFGDKSRNTSTAFQDPDEFDEDTLERYEDERDGIVSVVNSVAEAFNEITIESPKDMVLAANSIAEVVASPDYIARDGQGAFTDLLVDMVDKLYDNWEELSVETFQSVATGAIASLGKIDEATELHKDFPSNTDLSKEDVPVMNFDSNLHSNIPDVGTFKDPAKALRDGKKIYSKISQQNFANKEVAKRFKILDKVSRIITKVKPKSPDPFVINTGGMELKVAKNTAKDLVSKPFETSGGKVVLPSLSELFPDQERELENETMIFEAVAKVKSPSPENSGGLVNKFSNAVSFSFRDKDGNRKEVKNLENPIPIMIRQEPNKPEDQMNLKYANPEIVATREKEYLFYHEVMKPEQPAVTSIHLIFRPTDVDPDKQLLVLVSFDELPDIEKKNIEHVCLIPSHTDFAGFYGDVENNIADPYTCFVESDTVKGRSGMWKIGVRQLDPIDKNIYTSVSSLPTEVPDAWRKNKNFTQNYKLQSCLGSCASTDDDKAMWTTDGCKPGPMTTSSSVQCLCTHFTTFAGGWVVAPNTIDWNFVFSNADFFKNPTLYITEIVIVVVYILAMIWARRQDRQDIEKLGLAPLPDNDPRDKYYYEIFVSTGMRRNAGTESKVHFILSGEEDETDVRTLADNKRKILCRGNLDGFLMAVPSDLGHLMYLRIWHDNSGKSKAASWYLNHIIIRDIQTDKKYFFIADRWFAVEEDDGQVDRVIPIAGKEQMSEFGHLFREQASKNLSDGHLWFSVIARPPQSRFTRCQRVSCCLCLLFMTMLANAMFYQTAASSTNAYTFGPFALTPEQIFIGVASNIIIFPVNFLIIMLFRKSRPRKLRPSRVEEALKARMDRTTSVTDVNPKMKSSQSTDRPGTSFLMEPIRTESSLSRPETSMSSALPAKADSKLKGKKKKCELPWWFRIIGWILLWICVLVSAAFVTFYGIMFQDMKCKKWITSMLISFFTSVFLTQPIKVFLFAIIFSLIIKNPGGDDEEDDDEEECKIATKEDEMLHQQDEGFSFISPQRAMYKPKPPDPKVLEAARQQRLKEIQMWAVIREIVFYAFFLWILMVISYKSISTESYYYKFSMQQVFILTNDTKHSFTKVKNTNDFWVWARTGMLRGLRAGPYYNNYPPFYMRGYINDKVSRLMGYATLRQVRVKPNTCKIPVEMEGVIPQCNNNYDMDIEQQGSYAAGWQPLTNPNDTREEYTYMTGESLNSYPYWGHIAVYGGGGYIVKLNQAYEDMIEQFVQLEQENWIDKYTRAVFLEFTVYNPSINLFSISTLLSEFQPSGGVLPSYRFEPCMLLPYMSSVLLFQIACEIVYFLFTIWFIIKEIRNLYKEKWKYFLHFWNLVELCIIAMSVTAIVIYFYRLYSVNKLTEYFKETHGNEYMKFQYVGYWTELFNYIIGFLVFFASMKFLKLLRFNKRISLLSDTLKNSGRDLIHFSIIFNIVFLAFMQMFYLVYVANLDTFRTFITSCEAGIVMMMGKFDIYNMLNVNQWFTQIFIFLFVVTITFIIVNMFLSILNETFSSVRTDLTKQQNDYEIVDFMMGRFKLWTGLGKAPPTTINPTEMENERNRTYRTLEGQIDYFPSQIDRFLSSISHMYMERSQFDDFLRKGAYGKMAMKAQMADARHPQPGPSGVARPRRGSRPRSGRGMTDVQTD